jgi:phenylpropionate dioxygenase-like ring-hydroxylating dioxygenase large terminal subunit
MATPQAPPFRFPEDFMTQHPEADEVQRLRRELAALSRLPASRARTMPPAYYTSAAFLAFEREQLFRREWVCLGHAAEIARPGDYFTTELIGEPLLVVRGEDDRVRVLSNVCRHRANLVASGSGNARRFVCGYHAWSYHLDGRLAAAPLMGGSEAFDKGCRLPELACEIWQDFIFVNLDGQAEPLAPRLDGFLPAIRNYHHPGRHHQFVGEEVWRTNWKCLVENFMEGYHLSFAHLKTLHPITPTALCRKIPTPFGMTAYTSGYAPEVPERGPYHPDLTAEERRYSVLFSVFPNLTLSIVPNVTLYLMVRPIDADTVGVRWGLAGTIDDPEHPDVIRYRDLCLAFNAEDRAQLEGVQKGLKSRHYAGGPLAPPDYEGTIWDFTQYMAARLGSEAAPQPKRGGRRAAG